MKLQTDPFPALVFEPEPGVRFGRVEVPIPATIPDSTAEKEFIAEVNDAVWDSCSSVSCIGWLLVSSSGKANHPDERIIQGVKIACSRESCPLIGPGGMGDREPRVPVPPPPALHGHASLPSQ